MKSIIIKEYLYAVIVAVKQESICKLEMVHSTRITGKQ